jgi:hypothetical protein
MGKEASGTPFARGGIDREQGTRMPATGACGRRRSKSLGAGSGTSPAAASRRGSGAGSARPGGRAGGRLPKVLVVALARKLPAALWRFAI